MEDNKKDVKILSDEELENVAGGLVPRFAEAFNAASSTRCPTYKDKEKCRRNFSNDSCRFALCVWIDGKCQPSVLR
jgi:hypothetical protein